LFGVIHFVVDRCYLLFIAQELARRVHQQEMEAEKRKRQQKQKSLEQQDPDVVSGGVVKGCGQTEAPYLGLVKKHFHS